MLDFMGWIANGSPPSISEGSNPGAKTGLYPLGYGGVGLYPHPWYITRSADAIYYMTIDERIYKGEEGGKFDIKHLKGKVNTTMNAGEGGIWNITNIKSADKKTRKDESAGSFAIVGCKDNPNYQVWGARSDLNCKRKEPKMLNMKFGDWLRKKGKKKNG